METIILAGGLGTRLRSVVDNVPKPLAPINGSAFLDLLLAKLAASPFIQKVILATGYKKEIIREHYKDASYPFTLLFSEEEQPLGTGGAVRQALQYIDEDDLLVLNGDSFLDLSLAEMKRLYESQQADVLLAAVSVAEVERYGRLVFEPESGRIRQFAEKSAEKGAGFVNGGIYMMKKALWHNLRSGENLSLEKDLFPAWLCHKMLAYICDGTFIDIGTPDSWKRAQTLLKERL